MDSAGTASVDGAHAKNEEARLMGMIRQAHTKALQMTLEGLGPEVFHKYVRQIEGKVDADASALAARVAVKVVERSEEGFRQLCDRMAVNEKLLALEQAVKEKGGEGEVEPATGGDELTGEPLSPLPGGRLPAELIRESVMRLKSAERAKLQAQVEETEAGTNVEAAKVAELESALANRLAEVTAIQQALTEVL